MARKLPQRNPPLEEQLVDILHERIAEGVYPVATRLPAESELAKEFNVSRTTVRTALSILQSNGMLKRRHGVGTFVSPLSRISNSLIEVRHYRDLINEQGFEFSQHDLTAEIKVPSQAIGEALEIEEDSKVLEIDKVFFADGEVTIFNTVSIPEWVFKSAFSNEEVTQPGFTSEFFDFMEQCHHPVTDFYGVVKSEVARNIPILVDELGIDRYTPILVIEEIGFDHVGKPVVFQVERLVGDRMTFEVARKRKISTKFS